MSIRSSPARGGAPALVSASSNRIPAIATPTPAIHSAALTSVSDASGTRTAEAQAKSAATPSRTALRFDNRMLDNARAEAPIDSAGLASCASPASPASDKITSVFARRALQVGDQRQRPLVLSAITPRPIATPNRTRRNASRAIRGFLSRFIGRPLSDYPAHRPPELRAKTRTFGCGCFRIRPPTGCSPSTRFPWAGACHPASRQILHSRSEDCRSRSNAESCGVPAPS